MDLSMKWLAESVKVDVPPRKFAEAMTMSGSKVEGWAKEGNEIEGVVVGRVLSIKKHPDADTLVVCSVDVGGAAPLQIVTGATNLAAGDLVPAALDGASLPGGKQIHSADFRGVESQGMLCSPGELGLTEHDFPYADANGIFVLQEDCKPGDDIHAAIGLDDTVVEFEITPNRPDCLSVLGLAREASATFGVPFEKHEPRVKRALGDISELLSVTVENPRLCPRYVARVAKNVKIAPSPRWMRERLRASGVRPINNIVDITNYVMLEYGQPMHAFDYRYVGSGKIVVRESREGETLTTLDGNVRNLKPGMLVIADETKPIGLAGIMGGENSEILPDTTTVVFESANFDGTSIRQTALALGMRTESSGKFEKNLDPMMTVPAVQRACELVEMLACGDVMDGMVDILNYVPAPKTLELEPEKINALLGTNIPREDMVKYLNLLEIPVEGNTIHVPSWRPDLNLMADIAEEVGRSYGYNEIPITAFKNATQGGYSPEMLLEAKAGAACRSVGFSEIITYSFVSPSIFDQIRLGADSPLRNTLKIQNPLGEDTSVMRTTALPSMLDILARNSANHNKAAKLYELAKVYLPVEGQVLPQEPKYLMLGTYGAGEDFFSLKGELDAVLGALRLPAAQYTADTTNPSYHPGRCARITIGGEDVGCLGQIHPLVTANYGMDCEVYCAEIRFDKLLALQLPEATYVPLPKYPAVTRDLAIVCREEVTVGEAEAVITQAAGKLLRNIRLFDVYRGTGVPEGKKSLAFSLELRADDRTLTDTDSETVTKNVLEALENQLGAVLR